MKPFFISIPHSGEDVPIEAPWLKGLPENVLMCDVDRYVDKLYAKAIDQLKLPAVIAKWHRYVVDLNRRADEIDKSSVAGTTREIDSHFVSGIHWAETTKGDRLMQEPMSMATHDQLIEKYFTPFHQQMKQVYDQFRQKGFKNIYHIDAHSMPSKATAKHTDRPGELRPDIVVSDYEGKSAAKDFADLVIEAFKSAGFGVSYNWPYKGGRLTQDYGQPQKGQHTIQVEMNRALYMDENSKKLLVRWPDVQKQVFQAIKYIWDSL